MKPLSEQLADLAARAKRAEDDAAAAQTEARAKVQARIDQLKADAATRTAEMNAQAASKKDAAAQHWAAMQRQIHEQVNSFDADVATWNAERTEANAAEAIGFALGAIDYAEWAVLDAVAARAEAESFQ